MRPTVALLAIVVACASGAGLAACGSRDGAATATSEQPGDPAVVAAVGSAVESAETLYDQIESELADDRT